MSQNTKSILFSDHIPSRSQGGEELVLREILLGLAARGWRCLLAYHEWGDLIPIYEKAGIKCRQFDLAPVRLRNPSTFVASVTRQALWARREGARLLHCNSYFRSSQAAAVKILGGFPGICHFHLMPPAYLSRQYRWGLKRLDRFIAVSAAAAEEWSSVLDVPRIVFEVLRNGLDTGRFRPDEEARTELRRELGIADDCIVFGYCGRLVQEKGLDVLFRAMARLAGEGHNVKLLVLGSDAQNVILHDERLQPKLANLAEQIGIADHISFLGVHYDVERWYNVFDALVLPSTGMEGLPLSVLEALACGRPAVASRVGGIPEILSGPLDELLVPPGDDEALAAVLRRLIADPRRRAEIGEIGRKSVEERFGLAGYLDRFERLASEAMHSAGEE